MANQSPEPDFESRTSVAASSTAPVTPRWVKVSLIIALIMAIGIAIVLATGLGGPHGPRRHIPSGDLIDAAHIVLEASYPA